LFIKERGKQNKHHSNERERNIMFSPREAMRFLLWCGWGFQWMAGLLLMEHFFHTEHVILIFIVNNALAIQYPLCLNKNALCESHFFVFQKVV